MCYVKVNIVVILCCFIVITKQYRAFDCHDDPTYDPDDGIVSDLEFTWLGLLQYIQIQKGIPHYFRVPRVILVSRQYVLSTAVDAAELPPGYALGNVVFGTYERDEYECQLTEAQIIQGEECDPAMLIIPVADVILHPSYKHSKIRNTLALLQLVQQVVSSYMLPVCLPFKNYLFEDNGKMINRFLKHLDFTTDIPRDFQEENKELITISLVSKSSCPYLGWNSNTRRKQRNNFNKTNDETICTSGCGFNSGSPVLIHEHTGHWTVIAISIGGPVCDDPLRRNYVTRSPHHIPLYPYLSWITSSITGEVVLPSLGDDPFGYSISRGISLRQGVHRFPDEMVMKTRGWVGRWWLGGIRCHDRGYLADDLYRFYFDILEVEPAKKKVLFIDYHIQIDAPDDTIIDCVKIGMPWFARVQPYLYDIGTNAVKIALPALRHKTKYRVNIECWGHNSTSSRLRNYK